MICKAICTNDTIYNLYNIITYLYTYKHIQYKIYLINIIINIYVLHSIYIESMANILYINQTQTQK